MKKWIGCIAATTAAVVGTLSSGGAAQARPVPHSIWVVTSVSSPYTTYGAWHACYVVTPRKTKHVATCTVSRTVSNTVSGDVTVSYAVLNSHVGFNTTASTTATGGAQYTIPAHAGGTIYWRAVYSTRTVHETKYHYDMVGHRTTIGSATVKASKYVTITTKYSK